MKKTILTTASVLALAVASPAFAQSTSTVTQDGNGNAADVLQTAANASTIEQIGDNNVADVDQVGIGTTGNSSVGCIGRMKSELAMTVLQTQVA